MLLCEKRSVILRSFKKEIPRKVFGYKIYSVSFAGFYLRNENKQYDKSEKCSRNVKTRRES
jgi:hypothetical protein